MFDIFSTNKYEKQICELHIKRLEVIEVHNQIRSDIFEFLTAFKRIRYTNPEFQLLIDKTYSEVKHHNNEVNKRIQLTKKHLEKYVTRL